MAFTEYGPRDTDTSVYEALIKACEGMDIKYVMHYARRPINARPCQLPGLLRVQAVAQNGQVFTAEQYKVGGEIRLFGF